MIIAAIVAILTWGALAFGANYPWAYYPLMAASFGTGAVALLRTTGGQRLPWPLIAALTGLGVAILLQLVPLPASLIGRLSPATDTILREHVLAYAVAGESGTHPLSIRPGSTWTALGFLLSLSVLMIGTSRALTRDTLQRLVASVAVLGTALAVIGIVQRPFFDGRIYGFWEPLARNTSFGPFVNHNHFAGWMLMALPLVVTSAVAQVTRGLSNAGPTQRERWLWWSTPEASRAVITIVAASLMALTLPLTMSRSGLISALIALSFVAWRVLRVARMSRWMGLVVLISAVGLSALVPVPKVVSHLASPSAATLGNRLPIWRDTVAMIKDFPLTGTGLNTYGHATLSYQTSGDLHWREAHGDYLQLAAEGGILLGVPLVVALWIFIREIRRRFERHGSGSAYWLRLGACVGLIAVAIQSLVEFSLQMPGNAVLFAVLGAVALREPDLVSRRTTLPGR